MTSWQHLATIGAPASRSTVTWSATPATAKPLSAPAIAPFRQSKAHLVIQPTHLFSLEFVVHSLMDDGTRLAINFEDNAIVTDNGVEWLYPPNSRLLLIR